ncbi:MAG: hypothetical protein ACKPEY_13770, partial [Planctomycetota bacterium]
MLLALLPIVVGCDRGSSKPAARSPADQSRDTNGSPPANPFAAKNKNNNKTSAPVGRAGTNSKTSAETGDTPSPKSVGSVRFTRVDRELMPEFTYQNGDTGRLLMVESIGGGVGWLDFDEDHRPDLYL